MVSRKWDTIYLAVDLHDTIFESNYEGLSDVYMPNAKDALQTISTYQEIKIILWSSTYDSDISHYLEILKSDGIRVDYFNENPEAENTKGGDFARKFYFNILLDDKAGFEPSDWIVLLESIDDNRIKHGITGRSDVIDTRP